jgi:hypothetical protein
MAEQAVIEWDEGAAVRMESASPRVAAFELTVTLTRGTLQASFRQPREVLGTSSLRVPVELPDEPIDASWKGATPVNVRVSAELLDVEGQVLGTVEAPLRQLAWTGDPARPIALTEPARTR